MRIKPKHPLKKKDENDDTKPVLRAINPMFADQRIENPNFETVRVAKPDPVLQFNDGSVNGVFAVNPMFARTNEIAPEMQFNNGSVKPELTANAPIVPVNPMLYAPKPNFANVRERAPLIPFNDGSVNPQFAHKNESSPLVSFNDGSVKPVFPVNPATVPVNPATAEMPGTNMALVQKPTALETTRAEISKRQNRKFDDKWGIMDTLKGAGLGFLKGFGATGNLGGGLGGALAGGVQGTIDPNTDEKWSNQNHLAKLYGEADTLEKQEEFDAKQRKAEQEAIKAKFDTEGVFLSNQKKVVDNASELGKRDYETLQAKDFITPEEAAAYTEKYGIAIQPYDRRKFEKEVREGDTFQRPVLGGGDFVPTNLPTERIKKPVNVQTVNPDGTKTDLPMLPNQAGNYQYKTAHDKAEAEAREAERIRREEEADYKEKTGYEQNQFKDAQSWQKAQVGAKGKIAKYQNLVKSVDASLAEVNGQIQKYQGSYDVSDLVKTKAALEKQRAGYSGEIEAANIVLNAPKPKEFKPSTSRPKSGNSKRKGAYSSAEIDRIIKQ